MPADCLDLRAVFAARHRIRPDTTVDDLLAACYRASRPHRPAADLDRLSVTTTSGFADFVGVSRTSAARWVDAGVLGEPHNVICGPTGERAQALWILERALWMAAGSEGTQAHVVRAALADIIAESNGAVAW